MSMAEPLMPHPEQPHTAYDEQVRPVREEHGEPAEANEELTSAGRAALKDGNEDGNNASTE